MPPGVMEHFETATRDPAFFRLHKYIDNLFKLHKDLLPSYSKEEVRIPMHCLANRDEMSKQAIKLRPDP